MSKMSGEGDKDGEKTPPIAAIEEVELVKPELPDQSQQSVDFEDLLFDPDKPLPLALGEQGDTVSDTPCHDFEEETEESVKPVKPLKTKRVPTEKTPQTMAEFSEDAAANPSMFFYDGAPLGYYNLDPEAILKEKALREENMDQFIVDTVFKCCYKEGKVWCATCGMGWGTLPQSKSMVTQLSHHVRDQHPEKYADRQAVRITSVSTK